MTTGASAQLPPAQPNHDWTGKPPLALAGIGYFSPIYEYAVLADRKASFFLSASGLMLTVLGFFITRIASLLAPHDWRAWLLGTALVAVVVLILVAAITAYISYSRLLPPTPPSLAVFREIARLSPEEYERNARALTHQRAFTDVLQFNHVLARWAVYKFRMVNRALQLLRVAIPLWMLVLLILAIAG